MSGAAGPTPRPRLAVLLSGSGRTLLNLHEAIGSGALEAQIGVVIASRPCLGAERAREAGLDTLVAPGEIPAARLGATLEEFQIDWIVLAGYLRLLNLPRGFERRAVNIHPALLPSFGGPGMYGEHVHRAVLEAGCRVSGCTVHLCDARFDSGPIVAQRACPVLEGDTPESLAARVFDLETALYPASIRFLLSGLWEVVGNRLKSLPGAERP